MLTFTVISIVSIFMITLVSGLYPFFQKRVSGGDKNFPISESLSAGVFLGASLLHMLGDASHDFYQQSVHYPLAFLLAGLMFLFLLLLEHIGREMVQHNSSSNSFAVLATVMLSIHAFLMGAALGLSQSFSVAVIIFFAIIAHKWAESFSLAVQINKSHFSYRVGVLLFFIFSLMTPAGVVLGASAQTVFAQYPLLSPIFSSLAAGTFLYLGTLHGLENATLIKQCCDLKRFVFVILGFAVMALVAVFL
jgi:zinc transporter 1/2/3